MKKLLGAFVLLFTAQTMAVSDLILVPGFFSSAVPAPSQSGSPWKQPYFSRDIVNHLAGSGYQVYVADNLSPVGSLADNGQRLIKFLKGHQKRRPGRDLVLLGHSAGGLYSLYAAAADENLPIVQIIAVTTPFRGLKFLKSLEELNVPVDAVVTRFHLKNLVEFKEDHVQNFLAGLEFKKPLRLDVFAGYQKPNLQFWNFKYLSRAMIPFQFFTFEKSDGMVTIRSSLGAEILKESNPELDLQVHSQPLPLEHWEYSLDASFSKAFQVTNISSLRVEQQRVYGEIMKQAGQ